MEDPLPPIDWWEYPGHWTEEGDYDQDAAAVVLPETFDLPGEEHHAQDQHT